MKIISITPDYRKADGTANQAGKTETQGNTEKNETTLSGAIKVDNRENEESLNREELGKKVEQMNQTAAIFNKRMHFQIHEDTGRVMVKILNSDSGEVITEIPSEKLLDMVARMEEMVGLIFDKRF
jgi:flagellar protein FlaG